MVLASTWMLTVAWNPLCDLPRLLCLVRDLTGSTTLRIQVDTDLTYLFRLRSLFSAAQLSAREAKAKKIYEKVGPLAFSPSGGETERRCCCHREVGQKLETPY
jgi:hypothetical protein